MYPKSGTQKKSPQTLVKKILITTLVILGVLPSVSSATTIDALLNKFVAKGVLTRADADELSAQAAQEKAADQKALVPDWVRRTSMKGDFRLRYQYENREGKDDRDRGRFRYRLVLANDVRDDLTVVFGLASGSSDPRSTNQTFQDTFSSKPVQIDLAYADYRPAEWVELRGGKMSNPLWTPADLLWDSDIRPEGAAVTFHGAVSDGLDLFLNANFFILDEYSDQDSPVMFALQGGGDWKFPGNARLKVAAAYYGFSSVKGRTLDFSSGTNTPENGGLKYDYDAIAAGADFSFDQVSSIVPYVGVYGEYVRNPDPSSENTGYLAGLGFGHKKLNGLGQWQVKYMYRRLERDAWLDVFPDSDFFGGATNVAGHEGILEVGLSKNVTLGADYYHSRMIDPDIDEDLFQADLVFKF